MGMKKKKNQKNKENTNIYSFVVTFSGRSYLELSLLYKRSNWSPERKMAELVRSLTLYSLYSFKMSLFLLTTP
jgi:hypothetical protein